MLLPILWMKLKVSSDWLLTVVWNEFLCALDCSRSVIYRLQPYRVVPFLFLWALATEFHYDQLVADINCFNDYICNKNWAYVFCKYRIFYNIDFSKCDPILICHGDGFRQLKWIGIRSHFHHSNPYDFQSWKDHLYNACCTFSGCSILQRRYIHKKMILNYFIEKPFFDFQSRNFHVLMTAILWCKQKCWAYFPNARFYLSWFVLVAYCS